MKSSKNLLVITLAATMAAEMAMTTLAGQWQQTGTTWKYQNDNGAYTTGTWQWIDGKCYYFDGNGQMLANTTTPDGYTVDANGVWVVNGVVQTQTGTPAAGTTNNEIAAAVARAKAAGAGSYQDQYISGGWKSETLSMGTVVESIRANKDTNGMIVSPTSGIISKNSKGTVRIAAGSDRSIRLATDPSGGNLQPNWIYNPLGKQIVAPPVICMDKNVYDSIGWQLTGSNTNGDPTCRMDTCDTAGSWVYNSHPSGSADFMGLGGQLSGWMYRYADGSYAANGIVCIYNDSATWDSSMNNLAGSFILGQAYFFNENGFLVTNSRRAEGFVDEYGRVCDGTA